MTALTHKDAHASWDGRHLSLEDIGGSLAVCTSAGEIVGATPSARALLKRLGVSVEPFPARLPESLWRELTTTPLGEATQWRPSTASDDACLGCTRYGLGQEHTLLLMREVSQKHLAQSLRLHQQRLEATGRLVATIVHDLRAPLASIVFNADVLCARTDELTLEELSATARGIQVASSALRRTIDGLLDFARLGPPLREDVSVAQVFDRVTSLLRPVFRDGGHVVATTVADDSVWVRGNPLLLEQVLVNLVMNALEASSRPVHVQMRSEPAPDSRRVATPAAQWRGMIRIIVSDDGPGVPPEIRQRIFEPFFTTKPEGTGLGLNTAREAVRQLGGELSLEPSSVGACFAVTLVAGDAPPRPEGA